MRVKSLWDKAMRKPGFEPGLVAQLDPKGSEAPQQFTEGEALSGPRNTGNRLETPASSTEAATQRFWSHVERRGPDECWPWLGCRYEDGYGKVKIAGKVLRANRVALEIATGCPLGDSKALHTCDNPPCCNPAHLFAGTQLDNMEDRDQKGRNHYSNLTQCPNGHPYTPENTRLCRAGGTAGRRCLQCDRTRDRARRGAA